MAQYVTECAVCSCLKDCPKCCAHFGNYFYSLCRDPKNPKGSLNYCNPYGEEARHSG